MQQGKATLKAKTWCQHEWFQGVKTGLQLNMFQTLPRVGCSFHVLGCPYESLFLLSNPWPWHTGPDLKRSLAPAAFGIAPVLGVSSVWKNLLRHFIRKHAFCFDFCLTFLVFGHGNFCRPSFRYFEAHRCRHWRCRPIPHWGSLPQHNESIFGDGRRWAVVVYCSCTECLPSKCGPHLSGALNKPQQLEIILKSWLWTKNSWGQWFFGDKPHCLSVELEAPSCVLACQNEAVQQLRCSMRTLWVDSIVRERERERESERERERERTTIHLIIKPWNEPRHRGYPPTPPNASRHFLHAGPWARDEWDPESFTEHELTFSRFSKSNLFCLLSPGF